MDMSFLQIILYVFGSILLACLIVLIIKIIYTVNRINFILDNVERKMTTIDKAFNSVSRVVDTLSFASDKVVNGITSLVTKVIKKKESEDD